MLKMGKMFRRRAKPRLLNFRLIMPFSGRRNVGQTAEFAVHADVPSAAKHAIINLTPNTHFNAALHLQTHQYWRYSEELRFATAWNWYLPKKSKGEAMSLKIKTTCLAVLALGILAAQLAADEPAIPKTQKDKTGSAVAFDKTAYCLGMTVGKNMREQKIDVDVEALLKGMRDGFTGQKSLMTDEEIQATMVAFDAEFKAKRAQGAKVAAVDNKKAGEAFLAENKTKKGVVTTPSGLQYIVIKNGAGKKPTDADTVECHYRGTLIDGTEFDSSYKRGQPATFPVAGVIPGWTEALKLMPVGSKWQLFVPSQLGYGEHGAGASIGPNSTLIFEVELLGIK